MTSTLETKMSLLKTMILAFGFTAIGAAGAINTDAMAHPNEAPTQQARQQRSSHPPIFRLASKLDLTEEQQSFLEEIKSELQAERETRREQRPEHTKLSEMIAAESIDADAMRDQVDQRINKQSAQAHQFTDWVIEFHGMLDADQRQQLSEMLENAETRNRRGRGQGQHPNRRR